jgi:N-dimethylarginine dimethylaminohydrolase
MPPSYLMSPPPTRWRIRGGENFRSRAAKGARTATNPRAAMKEWISLCDAIVAHGGRVIVIPTPDVDPPLTGMMYTANSGALFSRGGRGEFVVSRMSVAHRLSERTFVRGFVADALGLATDEAPHTWEGQADVTPLPGGRYLLTWGVRSVSESVDDVRRWLGPGARTVAIKLRDPWFHGDTCLNPLTTRDGRTVLLAFAGAFVDVTLEDLNKFLEGAAEVLTVDEADALGYACNALSVDGTVLLPKGLSPRLRDELARRGFDLEELELGELFGKGGGGPRCLVNQLRGFQGEVRSSDYAQERARLVRLADTYPTSVEEAA